LGIIRQAHYQHSWEVESSQTAYLLILKEVMIIRKEHNKIGTRKLYGMLEPFMIEHGIKMGRDALFDLLAANGLLVKKRKQKIQTTYSNHWPRKYPNLIRDFIPKAINQLWVSDITYWKTSKGEHLYIILITDAYSRKIVGYHSPYSGNRIKFFG
jgi:putative transposase